MICIGVVKKGVLIACTHVLTNTHVLVQDYVTV